MDEKRWVVIRAKKGREREAVRRRGQGSRGYGGGGCKGRESRYRN